MVQSSMRTQLIATMRKEFARRYSADESLLDTRALLRGFSSARLIGSPGFSMRISVEEQEAGALKKALSANFILGNDYTLQTFPARRPARRMRSR